MPSRNEPLAAFAVLAQTRARKLLAASLKWAKYVPAALGNWLNAIRTRGTTVAPCEEGHRTASHLNLALISMILGRKIQWDPEKEIAPNDPEATRMALRPMRSPWHI